MLPTMGWQAKDSAHSSNMYDASVKRVAYCYFMKSSQNENILGKAGPNLLALF